MFVCMVHTSRLEEKTLGICFLLLAKRSWRSNLGHQVCEWVPLPTEGSHWLMTSLCVFSLFLLFKTEIHCVAQSSLAPNCLWLQRDETARVGQHAWMQHLHSDLGSPSGSWLSSYTSPASLLSSLLAHFLILLSLDLPFSLNLPDTILPKAFVLLLPLRKTSPVFSVIPPSPALTSLS